MIKATFTGNITADAVVRATPAGQSVCSFSVAVNHGTKEKPRVTYVDCSIWGKRAEGGLPTYLKKGTKVLVDGEPGARAWTPKDGGDAKASLTLLVDELEFIGGKNESNGNGNAAAPAANGGPASQEGDDDIPW